MSSVLSTPPSAESAKLSTSVAVDQATRGQDCYAKGVAYLMGAGEAENHGMAVACFLDGSDLGHPESMLKVALLYYIGVGVSRSLPSARQYATQYLACPVSGGNAGVAREILAESLGTENARRLLFGDAVAAVQSGTQTAAAQANRRTIAMGIGAIVAVIGAAAGGLLLHTRPTGSLSTDMGDIATLIPEQERSQARMQALAIAARLHTAAANAQRQRAAEAAAAEVHDRAVAAAQAEEQQREQARSTGQAESEAKAQAEEQARSRANQGNSNASQNSQLQAMYSTAVDAMRHGQYDRASGIADSLLALAPSDAQVLRLKQDIQTARQNAINRMKIQ